MTRAQIRRTAWDAHEWIEWLNTHVVARSVKDNKRLESYLRDLNKAMLKIIDAPVRDPKVDLSLQT